MVDEEYEGKSARARLDELLTGVWLDLFEAEQARQLLDSIGPKAAAINTQNFARFFGQLQIILQKHVFLMMGRVFEAASKRFQIRSVFSILDLLMDVAESLPIRDRERVVATITTSDAERAELKALPDGELTRRLAEHFRASFAAQESTIHRLRMLRSKRVAHSEVVAASFPNGLPTTDLLAAAGLALEFVQLLSRCYLDAVKADVSADARKTVLSLGRLLAATGAWEPPQEADDQQT